MGAGISAGVSRQAYPNIRPWSPAPSSLFPEASTPWAMSADCAWRWIRISESLQWNPCCS